MKIKHLILLTTAVAASSLSSCKEEPYIITAEEEYTRNFIKEFGLIDPKQDWNLAEGSTVTVKVGSTPAEVKAYMKVDNTYYLVANLKDVAGDVKIPFDMPEGTKDIMVKINGTRYYTSPGGTVDPANPNNPTSRSVTFVGTGENGTGQTTYAQYTTTSTIEGKTVTVVASNTANYTYFNALQMGPIISGAKWISPKEGEEGKAYRDPDYTGWEDFYSVLLDEYVHNTDKKPGILPESDRAGDKEDKITNYNSSFNDSGIYDDFLFDAGSNGAKKTFTLYPMYWCTSQNPTTLGVYMIDPSDNKIHKFPIYSTKLYDGDIEQYYPEGYYYPQSASSSGSGSGIAQVVDSPVKGNGGGGGDTPVNTTATEISCNLFVDISSSWIDNIGNNYFGATENGYIVKDKMDKLVSERFSTTSDYDIFWYVKDEEFTCVPENSIIASGHKYTISSLDSKLLSDGKRWEATATFVLQDGAANAKALSRDSESESGSTYPVTKNLVTEAKTSDRWGKPYTNNFPPYTLSEKLIRSRGVEITVEGYDGEFGMYIEFSGTTLYSQKGLNEAYAGGLKYPNDERGREVYGNKAGTLASSFAASYLHPISKQLYFSFEDWTGSSSDGDLNDLIFMFSGVTKIVTPDKEVTVNEPDEVDEPYQWLLAVEDLGATDDFDFNDIIVGITAEVVKDEGLSTDVRKVGDNPLSITQDGETVNCRNKVTFTALAAGGTLPAYVYFDSTPLYPDDQDGITEWHQWFGHGSGTMINTNYGGANNVKGKTCTIYFGTNDGTKFLFSLASLATDAKDSGFKIGINKAENTSPGVISHDYFTKGDDGYFIKPSDPGTAPQMFLIPDKWDGGGKWQWPTERTHIQNSYGRFGDWVNGDDPSAIDWYKDTGKGVCRPVPSK